MITDRLLQIKSDKSLLYKNAYNNKHVFVSYRLTALKETFNEIMQ